MPSVNDFSRFASRLHIRGTLIFDSAHRIGAERSLAVDAPDLPVLRTLDGRPYIPGSSIKGAWRAYTEAILSTLQAQQAHGQFTFDPLQQKGDPAVGLTDEKIKRLRREIDRDESVADADKEAALDGRLREESSWTGRLFGNAGLASKLLIRDAVIVSESWLRTEVRDGVAIDRDAARAADGFKYQFEVVPAGARFPFEAVVENGSPEELGLVVLGLRAFERGEISLGGAKSRGLGWCRLDLNDWSDCRYVTADDLFEYLLGDDKTVGQVTAEDIDAWRAALRAAIVAAGEGSDA